MPNVFNVVLARWKRYLRWTAAGAMAHPANHDGHPAKSIDSRLHALTEAVQLISSTLDTNLVLERLVAAARRLFDASSARFWLLDDSQTRLMLAAQAGITLLDDDGKDLTELPVSGTMSGDVVRSGRPYQTSAITTNPMMRRPKLFQRLGVRSFLGVPVRSREKPIGVLVILTTEARVFSPDEVELAEALAQHAAISLENAQLYEQTSRAYEAMKRGDALEAENRRIKELSHLKDLFLANMSHELRTPLNAIIGFAELLHEEKVGALTPEQREHLSDILNSSRHLLHMITDALDLAQLEAKKIKLVPESLNPTQIVDEVVKLFRHVADEKRIELEVAAAPDVTEVVVDRSCLRRIAYNYVSNAIKFTPAGGRVDVRVRPEYPDRFRIEVSDTGVGIAPEDLDRLFVTFEQLDAGRTKRFGGAGLGLAVAKRLAEAQGGKVGVESVAGQGSTFYVVLPRRPIAEAH